MTCKPRRRVKSMSLGISPKMEEYGFLLETSTQTMNGLNAGNPSALGSLPHTEVMVNPMPAPNATATYGLHHSTHPPPVNELAR
jgi:hypothetical protein